MTTFLFYSVYFYSEYVFLLCRTRCPHGGFCGYPPETPTGKLSAEDIYN